MKEYPFGNPKIGECPHCGGSVTADHRCPVFAVKTELPMTDNKTLREQVEEAIKNTPFRCIGDDNGWPTIDFGPVADAAIKAVMEGMRCGRCEMYRLGSCDLDIFGIDDCFGCIRWERKQ